MAETQLDHSFALPFVAKALARKHLDVLVIGAGSSTLPGPNGAANAYPARLQAALLEAFPNAAIKVTTDVKAGRTAPDSLKVLVTALKASKPALVVWQAGTVDAMQQLELDAFNTALDRGVEAAHVAGSDVILVNGQYSPRTESMIALGTYADNMRWVALQREVPLLDRFSIMKLWAELGTFDFSASTKKLDIAERVHDCIGRLLADLVVEATKPVAAPEGAR
ncbi:MAG: SGNH/GDSL hydrolase family protein [Pseudolabrys sp.]|nr:SGNH/GDSL hydrolase family protein [Pseudolabrys sp.]